LIVIPVLHPELYILETFRFDAIQIVEQIFDSPDVSPLMCHARPYAFVAIDDSPLVITDNKPFPGRPNRIQRTGPPVTLRQIVPGELFLEKSNEVV